MPKESEYHRNSARVREIYGVAQNDKSYSMHHIIQRSDIRRYPEIWGDYHVNQKSNLIPLKIRVHKRVHEMINATEGQAQLPREHGHHRKRGKRRR